MQYGQDPNIASRPDGLLYAAKLAAGDLYAAGLLQTQHKVATQQATIGDLQRKTAVEGGGFAPTSASPRVNAINDVRETGSRQAARSALGAMFKDAGILKEN